MPWTQHSRHGEPNSSQPLNPTFARMSLSGYPSDPIPVPQSKSANVSMQAKSASSLQPSSPMPRVTPDSCCATLHESPKAIDSPVGLTAPHSPGSLLSSSSSPVNEERILAAKAKHRSMVSLMRKVYRAFAVHGEANGQNISTAESSSSAQNAQSSSSQQRSSHTNNKRARKDRDSPPPDGSERRRRRTNSQHVSDVEQQRLLACPWHKYNPMKYCANEITKSKYRSCAGPGFPDIRRLK